MRGWAERTVAAAAPLGERPLLAAALAVRAWAGAMAGDGQQAQAHCDEATELADGLSDEELAPRLNTLAHLASSDVYLDRFPAATRHAQRALGIGRKPARDSCSCSWRRCSECRCGSRTDHGSRGLLDGAVEAARLAGNIQNLAWNLFNRSFAALVAGDLNVALATANESVELDEDMEPGPYSAAAGAALASTLLETGKPTGASTCCSRVPGRGTPADRRRLAGAIPRGADLGAGQPAAAAERPLAATAALESVAAHFDAARAGMRGTSTYSRQPTATVRPLSSSSPQQHSAPSACFGTATRQSTNCASSAGTSIAAGA
jgi:hypothetical protein